MSSVNLQAPFGVPLLTESVICPQSAIPHEHASLRDLHVHQSAFAPEIPDTNRVDMQELYNKIASNDERHRHIADRVIDERTTRIHGFPDAEIAVFDHIAHRRHRAIAPKGFTLVAGETVVVSEATATNFAAAHPKSASTHAVRAIERLQDSAEHTACRGKKEAG